MATNPMQRRARNSFLLGALLMTLILGAVMAVLFFMMMNLQKEKNQLQAATVYVTNKDISSGSQIGAEDITPVKVSANAKPANAVVPANFVGENEDGTTTNKKGTAKVNLKKGTIVGTDMLYIDGEKQGNDIRKQEYNTIVLPMDLNTGDYVDIRLLLPSGQDLIVISKKRIEIPQIAGVDSKDTINMELSEDEILTMSNAIVENYMIDGSKLYATKYTDAGSQEASTPTYPVNGEVARLVESNPNIVSEALNALRSRYNRDIRENYINSAINSQDGAKEKEQEKMKESITKSQSTREEYLQSLGGTVTQ